MTRPSARWLASLAVAVSALSVLLAPGPARGEPYLGVYLSGVPSSERDLDAKRTFVDTGAVTDFKSRNVDLESSILFGGTAGYRFASLPFLAVEVDGYHLSPDVKGQTRIATSPTAGSFAVTSPGGDLDLTIVGLSAVGSHSFFPDATVPEGRLQAYVGAGLGIVLASVDVTGRTDNATFTMRDRDVSLGPQVKLGGRWFFTRNLAAFLEFRFLHPESGVKSATVRA